MKSNRLGASAWGFEMRDEMTLTLPVANRERIMFRLHEAEAAAGKRPSKIMLNPRDYAKLVKDMRRYGFVSTAFRHKPLHVLNVPIDCAEDEETAPDDGTIKFEWSDHAEKP